MRKFRMAYQHDTMQCGVACLRMVCMAYGMDYSLQSLTQLCAPTREGVSLAGIRSAASRLGLQSVAMHTALESLEKIPLPCILHWNQNHFVVLYRIRGGKYHVADPGCGKVKYSKEEFLKHWVSPSDGNAAKGIAMAFLPGPDFSKRRQLMESSSGWRKTSFLFRNFILLRKSLFGLLVCLLVISGTQLMFPFLTQRIVDVGINAKNLNAVWIIMAGQLALVFGSSIADFVRRWVLLRADTKMSVRLTDGFFSKLLSLPMSFFENTMLGDIVKRIDDHGRLNSFLTKDILDVFFSVVSTAVYTVFLMSYSYLLVLLLAASALMYALWLCFFMRRRKRIDYQFFDTEARTSNLTYELLTSMQEIKLQGCERSKRKEWKALQGELLSVKSQALALQQIQEAGGLLINGAKDVVITVTAAAFVINGQMTLGMMLAMQYIIGQVTPSVGRITSFIYSVQDVSISLERIGEVYGAKGENRDSELLDDAENMDICLESLSFCYDPHSARKAIDGISLRIPQGRVTAIVGPSGCGKTTLLKLMLGYYKITDGTLTIGGKGINTLDKSWWRSECGVVMQDGKIFSDTIARNIATGDTPIDEKRLAEAAKAACVDEFAAKLPLGYSTKIGRDGIGLSQGQKQRILIARAVYRDPKFVFLDEATSSMDANNERRIMSNLRRFYKGRTVVVIAHRLSTVRTADNIIVVENGKIAEAGTHEYLISKRGAYYELVKNQLAM